MGDIRPEVRPDSQVESETKKHSFLEVLQNAFSEAANTPEEHQLAEHALKKIEQDIKAWRAFFHKYYTAEAKVGPIVFISRIAWLNLSPEGTLAPINRGAFETPVFDLQLLGKLRIPEGKVISPSYEFQTRVLRALGAIDQDQTVEELRYLIQARQTALAADQSGTYDSAFDIISGLRTAHDYLTVDVIGSQGPQPNTIRGLIDSKYFLELLK